jgi:catechol 2,3-dioxygenase-like lactoylglutathione lyase family enzyme
VDKQPMIVYPRTINHIAVSVTNLDKAVKWYQEVFGFSVMNGPIEIVVDDSRLGMVLKDIHGPKLKKMRIVWLSSGNQVGFEIFEFIDPKAERRTNDNFEYWKSGFFHICITDPNIEELCKKISESGGKQRSKIWNIAPNKGYKMAFCEDPFGNVIEIYTHGYEHTITSV